MAKGDEKKEAPERENTERVVLVKVTIPKEVAIGLPFEATTLPDGSIEAWAPVRAKKASEGKDGEVRIFNGSKAKAIEAFTGSGEDELPGSFKAISARSWKGTKVNVLPEKPKVETLWSED